jgi:hypothetical protein
MTMRASSIPLWVVLLLAAGCNGKPADSVAPVTITDPVTIKLVIAYDELKPAHKLQVGTLVGKLQRQQERETWWAARLRAFGIAALIAGTLALLGRGVSAFGWAWGVPGAVLGWAAKFVPLRWGIYALVAGAAGICAAIWIDPLFTFLRWTCIATGGVVAGVVTWELACIYYTGRFDRIGDGKKPNCRGKG